MNRQFITMSRNITTFRKDNGKIMVEAIGNKTTITTDKIVIVYQPSDITTPDATLEIFSSVVLKDPKAKEKICRIVTTGADAKLLCKIHDEILSQLSNPQSSMVNVDSIVWICASDYMSSSEKEDNDGEPLTLSAE